MVFLSFLWVHAFLQCCFWDKNWTFCLSKVDRVDVSASVKVYCCVFHQPVVKNMVVVHQLWQMRFAAGNIILNSTEGEVVDRNENKKISGPHFSAVDNVRHRNASVNIDKHHNIILSIIRRNFTQNNPGLLIAPHILREE